MALFIEQYDSVYCCLQSFNRLDVTQSCQLCVDGFVCELSVTISAVSPLENMNPVKSILYPSCLEHILPIERVSTELL